jgi:hypothetical protein
MPTLVNRGEGGKVAIYIKPTSGDVDAPFTNPGQHLDKVLFHTDLDLYRVAVGPTEVTVTLPSVAAATRVFNASPPLIINGQVQIDEVAVLSHGLGVVPNYMIIYNGAELVNGDIVQSIDDANGYRVRFLGHWADTTHIYVSSRGVSSNPGNLPSMGFTCTVVVFEEGEVEDGVLIDFDSATGRLTLAGGKFDSNQKLLRAEGQAGDTPYDIIVGKSIDLNNGRSRVARGDGTLVSEPGYDGSFAAPFSFQGAIS